MKPIVIEDVSEILETFDLEEISELLRKQVEMKDGVSQTTDYFRPLYVKYKAIIDSDDNPGDVKAIAEERFSDVCTLFLSIICEEFEIAVDPDWKDLHQDQLPGLVLALQCFFVKDLSVNLQEVFINYIKQNRKTIYDVFEDRKNKKDAATLVNKRNFPIELAVILSNIYDTSSWILQQLSEESFVQYMSDEYGPLSILKDLMTDGTITGNFMDVIQDIYSSYPALKSEVCLNILSSFNVLEGKGR